MNVYQEEDYSAQEIQVLQLTADGFRCADIAKELGTSEGRIKNIRYILVEKTECKNFFQVLATAIRQGVID